MSINSELQKQLLTYFEKLKNTTNVISNDNKRILQTQ